MTQIFSQSTPLTSAWRLKYSALQCFVQQKNQEINPDSLRQNRKFAGWLQRLSLCWK